MQMLYGKGMYLWIIQRVERGDPNAIAELARQAGMSHVLIKISDGEYTYNVDRDTQYDRVPELVAALRQRGIQPWGWQYVYGRNPVKEAQMAIQRVRQFNLPGFVVNAEIEFKQPGMDAVAGRYMQELRKGLPNTPIALSTFRFPTMHRPFPYETFLDFCDLNMPQVYWIKSYNPAEQLLRTVREHQALRVWRPIVPTGCVYPEGTWKPTPKQIEAFMDKVRELELPGVNFWEWYYARWDNSLLWNAVKNYEWQAPAVEEKPDIAIRYINAMNSNDPVKVAALYDTDGVHVSAQHTRQGPESILRWYNALLRETLPGGRFEITGQSQNGNLRTITWAAQSANGRVLDGKDSLAFQDDHIAYHYTYFTVQKP